MDPVHHIFVDYENIQNIKLPLIDGKPATVTLVVGSRQSTLPVELASGLVEYAHRRQVRLVQAKATGQNALDFVLACELGGTCAIQKDAVYHIISRDKGFDATVEHLREHKIKVTRHDHFEAVPVLGVPPKPSSPKPAAPKRPTPPDLDGRVNAFLEVLKRNPDSRPANNATLQSSIHAYFGRELTPEEVAAVVHRLIAQKKIALNDKGAVTYMI